MKELILKFVRENPRASFVNLCRAIPGFAGDFEFGPRPNVIYWSGVSEAGIAAMGTLIRARQLHYEVTTVETYVIDGERLRLPVLRNKKGLEKGRHWLPVVVCEGPPE